MPTKKRRERSYTVKEQAAPIYLTSPDHDTVAVLIHGFTGSPYDMRELADYLFEHGVDVAAVLLAGHGTNIDHLIRTTHADWVNSVRVVAESLHEQGKRVILIGYSFGANLALHLAAQDSEKYAGVICLGASVYWRYRAYYLVVYYISRVLGIRKLRKPYIPKDKIEAWEATGNYADYPIKGLGLFRDAVKKGTRKELHQIKTPILIIHSRSDRISHPKSSEYLFDRVGSTYKEMFILPEFKHNPLRSESKNTIFEKILHFAQG